MVSFWLGLSFFGERSMASNSYYYFLIGGGDSLHFFLSTVKYMLIRSCNLGSYNFNLIGKPVAFKYFS